MTPIRTILRTKSSSRKGWRRKTLSSANRWKGQTFCLTRGSCSAYLCTRSNERFALEQRWAFVR